MRDHGGGGHPRRAAAGWPSKRPRVRVGPTAGRRLGRPPLTLSASDGPHHAVPPVGSPGSAQQHSERLQDVHIRAAAPTTRQPPGSRCAALRCGPGPTAQRTQRARVERVQDAQLARVEPLQAPPPPDARWPPETKPPAIAQDRSGSRSAYIAPGMWIVAGAATSSDGPSNQYNVPVHTSPARCGPTESPSGPERDGPRRGLAAWTTAAAAQPACGAAARPLPRPGC